jgi:hypothetical protein
MHCLLRDIELLNLRSPPAIASRSGEAGGCILKPGTRSKGGSPQDKSKISRLLSFFSMLAS